MNKKGGFLEWFYIIAALFTGVVALFCATLIVGVVIDTGVFSDDVAANKAITTTKTTLINLDNMFLFVVVGLSIFVIVSSAFVYNHPAYFVTGFFLLCIAVTVAAIASNTYFTFSTHTTIAATALLFPKINFLMLKLPFYIAFMGTAASIVMYVAYTKTQ